MCVGAPLTVLVARSRPLRSILLALMLVFIAGNTLTALAPNASMMLAARFIAGMPHGAYFGVASIVADKLAGRAFSVLAVSIVVSGATIANLVGVPGATLVTQILSWRVAYGIVAGVGLLVIIGVRAWVPQLPGLKDTGFRGQFRFLKFPAPWLIFLAIVLGNGGMFCWYSYISPFMGKVAGIDSVHMTLVMALAGLGMVLGNALSGRLSIRFPPTGIAEGMLAVMGTALLLVFFSGQHAAAALALMFICTACLFGVSAPQQMLLLQNAKDGEMLGAALAQVGFNIGNAIGAYCGGLSIAAGHGYGSTALIGALFAAAGFLLLLGYARKYGSPILGD